MPKIDNKYKNWKNGSANNIPTITNTNINSINTTVPNYGWYPVNNTVYHQYIGPIGHIVKKPSMNTYACC
jgi:hypothetical protein